LPRAVFGAGVLTATLPTASAVSLAVAAVTLKDEDPDLHKRLRGMDDGDSGWGFGRVLRALGGKKKESATVGGTPVAAKQDDVSWKESCTLVSLAGIPLDLDLILTIFTLRCLSSSGLDGG
jgi:hypothetical protein